MQWFGFLKAPAEKQPPLLKPAHRDVRSHRFAKYQSLKKIHFALGLFYLVIFGLIYFFAYEDLTPSGRVGIPLVTVLLPTIQFLVANGCRLESELARVASIVIGVVMLPLFPIGTILGLVVLHQSRDKNENEEACESS